MGPRCWSARAARRQKKNPKMRTIGGVAACVQLFSTIARPVFTHSGFSQKTGLYFSQLSDISGPRFEIFNIHRFLFCQGAFPICCGRVFCIMFWNVVCNFSRVIHIFLMPPKFQRPALLNSTVATASAQRISEQAHTEGRTETLHSAQYFKTSADPRQTFVRPRSV